MKLNKVVTLISFSGLLILIFLGCKKTDTNTFRAEFNTNEIISVNGVFEITNEINYNAQNTSNYYLTFARFYNKSISTDSINYTNTIDVGDVFSNSIKLKKVENFSTNLNFLYIDTTNILNVAPTSFSVNGNNNFSQIVIENNVFQPKFLNPQQLPNKVYINQLNVLQFNYQNTDNLNITFKSGNQSFSRDIKFPQDSIHFSASTFDKMNFSECKIILKFSKRYFVIKDSKKFQFNSAIMLIKTVNLE